jgi:hypothetical protein
MIRRVSDRASIEEGPGGLAVRIRAGRTHPFLTAWMIGIAAVAVLGFALVAAARGGVAALALLPWVGLLLGYEAAWRGWGREDVRIEGERARVERRIGPWVLWSRAFPAAAIKGVEARHWPIGLPDPMWRYDSWGLSKGALALVLDAGSVRVGTALGESETGPLVAALRAHLPGVRATG